MEKQMELNCLKSVVGNHITASPEDVIIKVNNNFPDTDRPFLQVMLGQDSIDPWNLVGKKTGSDIVYEWATTSTRSDQEIEMAKKYLTGYPQGKQLD